MADGRIIIDTKIDTSGAESGISSLSGKTKNLASTISKIAGGVTFAALTEKVVDVGSNFEATMSKVQAISGASQKDMGLLTEAAEKMGATTKFSATESAQALTYMGMAGWKTQDMLNGLPGIMNLASASGEDLATTSDIVTDALTAFGMQASDSAHFADILASASTNSNTNVSMLGESFKYCASVCGAMGYSAEDASIALGIMANSGIKSSQAGMTLKNAIVNLSKPTSEMEAVMTRYGLSLTDSNGRMLSLREVIEQLRTKMGGLDKATQSAAMSQLFGKESLAGMLAIVNASPADYDKLVSSIDNCDGSAQEMADTMNDNVKGSFTSLKSAAEGLAISIYDKFKGPLKDAIDGLAKGVSDLTTAFQEGKLDEILNNIAAAIVGIGVAWATIKIVSGVISIVSSFQELITVVKGASTVFQAFNLILGMNPIVLIVGAIIGLVAAFIYLWNTCEGFRNFWIELWNSVTSFFINAWNTISGFFTQTIPETFNAIWNFFAQTIPQWITNIANWFNQLPGAIGTALGFTLGEIVKWGVDSWNYLVTNVPLWINSIGAWFSELPGKIGTWLSTTVSNVVSWGYNLASAGYNAASQLVSSIVSTISSIPGKIVSIGSNIVQGLWNGIVGAKDWLIDKISGFANNVVDGFKSALGIHSPSRVMRDMVGKYIPQGISVGIDAEMPNTIKGLKGNINELYNELRGTVDIETAKTTAAVAATNIVNNYTTTNNNAEKSSGSIKDKIIIHNVTNIDGRTVAEVTAPYMDEQLGGIQGIRERG